MVRACYAPVASVALRYTGSPELAEEVTQDLFMAIWERGGQIALTGSLMSYLFTAVRHRALNARESLRARARHVPADAVLGTRGSADTPALLYDAAELSQTLRAAVDRLPPRGREVFLLSRRDGLTPAQIAAALGIGVQTVYTLLARALRELHQVMESVS
jgi:RNA polymerase sigma-70 factor (ECF subfamily)